MENKRMVSANVISAVLAGGKPIICEYCDGPLRADQWLHTACLEQKHGGELPEGFQELIDSFELDPDDQPSN